MGRSKDLVGKEEMLMVEKTLRNKEMVAKKKTHFSIIENMGANATLYF